MSKHKDVSGGDCIRVLCNEYGFEVVRQRGSHVVLKLIVANTPIVTVVPLHRSLKRGTLKNVLDLARVDMDDFLREF